MLTISDSNISFSFMVTLLILQRLKARAEKFGGSLSDAAKKQMRAERCFFFSSFFMEDLLGCIECF